MTCLHLHIGGPKTGTTSFQSAITRNGALTSSGFWAPETGRVRKGGHHHLARNLIGIFDQPREPLDPVAQLVQERDANSGDAIISAEYCDRLLTYYPALFARLLSELSKVFSEIRVIRVWRDASTLLSSRYQQSLCNLTHNQSFDDFVRASLIDEEVHLRAALAGFRDTQGRKSTGIHVPYDSADTTFDSVEAVCRAIGVRLTPAADDGQDSIKNPSRPLAQLAATKWLMDEAGLKPGGLRALQRRQIHDAIRDAIAERGGANARFQGLTTEILAESRARNQALRDQFAARFWDRSWDEATGGATNADATVDLSPQHMPQETAALARDVVDSIKPRLPKLLSAPVLRRDHAITVDIAHARLNRMSRDADRPARRPKSPRRLILHVGGHKTGTTSFQAHLTPQSELLERSGVWTPHFGQGHDGAHHHLIYRLIGAWSALDDVDAFKALRTVSAVDERPCLISSEFCHHLMTFQPVLFRKLIRQLGDIFDDIKIVQVVRETKTLINSHFQQSLCRFMARPDFADFTREYLERERRVMARTLNGFGMGLNIVTLAYRPHAPDFDSVAELAGALELEQPVPLPRSNERRSLARMAVSKRLIEDNFVDYDALIHAQRSRIDRAVGQALADSPAGPHFQGFDDASAAEADSANAALRRRFAEENWGMSWAEAVGDPDLGPRQGLEPSDLPDDVRVAVEDALVALTPLIPKLIYRGAVAPLGDWNVTVRQQFAQLARLNRAARAEEQAANAPA